ncbi:hypothetical protein DMI69_23515 [Escherichia coli]|nr:hypothetical protein [Escherichia coli]
MLIDLDSPESVDRAADEVIALTDNCLYGIFNNAGFGMPLSTISRAQMEQQFSANFSAHTSSPCACYPRCCRTVKGVVMTSSVMGHPHRVGAYAASKYALEAWSDALRMERHSGIKVSLIELVPFVLASPTTSIRRKVINQSKIRIAARFTLGPEAVVDKCMLLLARSRRCAIR